MNLNNEDTIAAIGTNPGKSAIGIVRLSGDRAIKIADRIFKSKNKIKIKDMKTYTLSYGYIVDEKKDVVDQSIITVMKKPRSYTRQDIVEINCHGGLIATNKILKLCINYGARLAEPGEFTRRAFLNGRIDLTQAEAVLEIINSKTEESLKIAANNIKGRVRDKIGNLKTRLLDIIIEIEAAIDFIEEDLEITPYEELTKRAIKLYEEITVLINDEKKGEIIKNGVKVVIAGKPNVGKSSLLNALAKKEKAIVTHIPGTTRDAIEEIMYVGGIPLILIDTAGIRKAKNIIEKIGVGKSLEIVESADLIIIVFDASSNISQDDLNILEKAKNKKVIYCLNKMDISNELKIKAIEEKINRTNMAKTSAIKLEGIKELESMIKKVIMGEIDINIANKIIVNLRQKRILSDISQHLKNAIKAMQNNMSEEFPASDLKMAFELFQDILGENNKEAIIDGIFSKFCIGK